MRGEAEVTPKHVLGPPMQPQQLRCPSAHVVPSMAGGDAHSVGLFVPLVGRNKSTSQTKWRIRTASQILYQPPGDLAKCADLRVEAGILHF